jgi:thiol-disulfide isomerase/thioredoxin
MSFCATDTYTYTHNGSYIGNFVEYIGFPLNGDWLQDARAKFAYTDISGESHTTTLDFCEYVNIKRVSRDCVSLNELNPPTSIYQEMPSTRQIITEISGLADFKSILESNPGVFIVKLGAEWCGPCKKIEPLVHDLISKLPTDKIQCAIIDVDESFEIYAFLKTKKMVNGIPAILSYYKGNTHYVPDDIVIGADQNEVLNLFNRAITHVSNM